MIKLYRSQTDNSSDCLAAVFAGFNLKKKKSNYQYLSSLPSAYLLNFVKLFVSSLK